MGLSYFIYLFAFLFILCNVNASNFSDLTTSDEELLNWFANDTGSNDTYNATSSIFTFKNETDVNKTETQTSPVTNFNVTTEVKTIIPELTSSAHFDKTSTTIKPNFPTEVILSVTTFEVLLEPHENATEINVEVINGSIWEEWKEIFTKSFWKKRFSDRSYTLALLLPIAIGVGAGCIIALCVCLWKRMCAKRRFVKNRIDKSYDGKTRDDKWMLLERQQASDTDEEV